MQAATLGRTGIKVSRICLGTMTWGEQNSEQEAHAQIEAAFEAGVNFMDAAELYPVPGNAQTQGLTETYIGNWFKATGRRGDWVLASKITGKGRDWIRDGRPITPAEIELALDASLKRLQTDYIDLYQLHWPNRRHYNFQNSWKFSPYGQDNQAVRDNMLETLEALDRAVKAGKIRAVGVSNDTSWGLMHYLHLAQAHGLPRPASVQNEYNLLRRQHDLDMAEISAFEDVGLLAYSPAAAGALSGKYLDGRVPEGSRGALGMMWRHNEHSEPAIRAYRDLARAHGLDPMQMAVAFCLTRPFVTAAIVGATGLAQLHNSLAAAHLVLDDEVLEGIAKIHRRYPRPN